jgi:MoxR-like ATPase
MSDLKTKIDAVKAELGKIVVGYDHVKTQILVCMLAGGHPLLRAVPGTAKTTLAKTLTSAIDGAKVARFQMTPDMKPSDIIGVVVYNAKTNEFEIQTGPMIGANIVLADEINRTTPKTLSAKLQAMQEGTVTIGGKTFKLEDFFFEIATMNPVEQEGTFPLPEAALDRFFMLLDMRYVSRDDEIEMLERIALIMGNGAQDQVKKVVSVEEILAMRKEVVKLAAAASRTVKAYIVDLGRATRPEDDMFFKVHAQPTAEELKQLKEQGEEPLTVDLLKEIIVLGGSPRVEICTLLCAAAKAFMDGDKSVEPDHVKAVFRDVCRHRILLSHVATHDGYTPDKVIDAVLNRVHVIEQRATK